MTGRRLLRLRQTSVGKQAFSIGRVQLYVGKTSVSAYVVACSINFDVWPSQALSQIIDATQRLNYGELLVFAARYYIGLDVHKKTISYCVKDASGQFHQKGEIGSTRHELDDWVKTLPQPWSVAMEATIFTGWIYDHLLGRIALRVALVLVRR